MKINHKIDFAKKLFNYENTGRKKEAGKNIRKLRLSNKFALRWLSLSKPSHFDEWFLSPTLITFGTAPCPLANVATLASGFKSRFLTGGLSNKFVLRWLSLSKPPHLV